MKNLIYIIIFLVFVGCNKTDKNIKEEIPEPKELSENLNSQHTCWGSQSIQDNDLYVSYINDNRINCTNGKGKILLEKVIERIENGKPVFEKLDEIIVKNDSDGTSFSKNILPLNDSEINQEYLVKFLDDRKEIITNVFPMWKIDYKSLTFKKIDIPDNLKFKNPDWLE